MAGCPSEETFVDLLQGRLAAEPYSLVHRHLDDCATCQELVTQLINATPSFQSSIGRSLKKEGQDLGDPLTPEELAFASLPPGKSPAPPGWDRYELLGLLGRGGMGSVYRARDRRLGRLLALKFLRGDNPGHAQRFMQEARAQGRIEHEHVCKVYEVGEANGCPFIAMQLIEGQPLSFVQKQLSLEKRVAILATVAEAVHAAHRQGVIHRDLKPSNIMMKEGEDGQWQPVVMDFGLAHDTAAAQSLTPLGTPLGTPHYMPPEQARGDVHQIDRRSDVYSLGAMLYELLTERPPFGGTAVTEILRQVLETEPRPPRQYLPTVPADLETIALKCLQKDPSQRYDSARALAEDLRRFLDGEPILGRPTSLGYRVLRWAGKRRAVMALTGVILLVSLVLGGLWMGARQLAAVERQARETVQTYEKASRALSLAQLPGHEVPALLETVKLVAPLLRRGEIPPASALEALSLAVDSGKRSRLLRGHRGPLLYSLFSPDGRQVLTVSQDQTARLWDARSGQPLLSLPDAGAGGTFSPDGHFITTSGKDGVVRLWDRQSGQLQASLPHSGSLVWALRFSPDGQHAVETTEDPATKMRTAWLWDVPSRRLIAKLPGNAYFPIPVVDHAAFSADGAQVVTGDSEQTISFWDSRTAERRATLTTEEPVAPPYSLAAAFSTDGKRIIATNWKDVWTWDGQSRRLLSTVKGHKTQILWLVSLSPDGNSLLITEGKQVTRLMDVATGEQRALLPVRGGWVSAATFSRDSQQVITAGMDGAQVWDVSTGQQLLFLGGHVGPVDYADISPDGQSFVTAGDDSSARLWTRSAGQHLQELLGHTGFVYVAEYSWNGKYVVTAASDATVRVWDAATGQLQATRVHQGTSLIASVGPDEPYVVTGSMLGEEPIQVWDWQQDRVLSKLASNRTDVRSLCFSPDGRIVASTSGDDRLRMWEWRTGQALWVSPQQDKEPATIDFSPDGLRFVSTDSLGGFKLWSMQTKETLFASPDNPGRSNGVEFSPDGRWLLRAGNRPHILDASTGHPIRDLGGELDAPDFLAFSRDGQRIITSGNHTVRVFDVKTGQQVHILRTEDGEGARLSPDGQRILLRHFRDHSVKIYPATTQALLTLACELLRYQPEWPEVQADCPPPS